MTWRFIRIQNEDFGFFIRRAEHSRAGHVSFILEVRSRAETYNV